MSPRGSALAVCALLAIVGCKKKRTAAPPPEPAGIAPYVEGGPCPYAFMLPKDQSGQCTCGPDATGYAYGTGQYAIYSDVCVAARHAGAVPAGGGTVTVALAAGCASFTASVRNGVSSHGHEALDQSLYFPGYTDATCSQQIGEDRVPGAAAPCPDVLSLAADGAPTSLTCHCALPISAGPVWGTGPYALDSSPCAAAVHAGVIQLGGGEVTLERIDGCASYGGGVSHGVAARASDATPEAFRFAGSAVACPK